MATSWVGEAFASLQSAYPEDIVNKIFVILFFNTFFFVASTFAGEQCPDLKGSYRCLSTGASNSSMKLNVESDIERLNYSIRQDGAHSSYIADGVARRGAVMEPLGTFWSGATCQAGVLYALSALGGNILSNEEYSIDPATKIVKLTQETMGQGRREFICHPE